MRANVSFYSHLREKERRNTFLYCEEMRAKIRINFLHFRKIGNSVKNNMNYFAKIVNRSNRFSQIVLKFFTYSSIRSSSSTPNPIPPPRPRSKPILRPVFLPNSGGCTLYSVAFSHFHQVVPHSYCPGIEQPNILYIWNIFLYFSTFTPKKHAYNILFSSFKIPTHTLLKCKFIADSIVDRFIRSKRDHIIKPFFNTVLFLTCWMNSSKQYSIYSYQEKKKKLFGKTFFFY